MQKRKTGILGVEIINIEAPGAEIQKLAVIIMKDSTIQRSEAFGIEVKVRLNAKSF